MLSRGEWMTPSFRQEKYNKARILQLSILIINLSLTRNYYRDVYKEKISSHVFYLLRLRIGFNLY